MPDTSLDKSGSKISLLEHALNASVCGVTITDVTKPDNPIIFVNDAFCYMTGYSKQETLGRNCRFLQGQDDKQENIQKIRDAVAASESCCVPLRNYKKDGTLFWNELYISPVRDDNGKVTNYIGVQNNITRRVMDQEIIEKKASLLEKSNHDLERFASVLSHDLKEPLRTISTFTSKIMSSWGHLVEDKGRKYLDFVAESATRAQMMVDGLLDYSRLEKKADKFKSMALSKVIEEAKDNLAIAFQESNAALELDNNLPEIECNEIQLVLLFQNLLKNSIKFKKINEDPKMKIYFKDKVFHYEDNGVGIDPYYAENVFEMFYRLHNHEEVEGSGIGLALCKRIIENHGGRIWVDSDFKTGTRFKFSIDPDLILSKGE